MKGVDNPVADALSRVTINGLTTTPHIDYEALAQAQQEARVGTYNCPSSYKVFPLPNPAITIICDTSKTHPRPVVPPSFRRIVFDAIHSLAHPGPKASVKLIAGRFTWQGLSKDVRTWAKACIACQRSKVIRHNKAPVSSFDLPDARFSHVHLDLVGPLPDSKGCRFLLTCVDRFTRWPLAVPIPDATSETVINAFLNNWVAVFGAPRYITTDRGQQFESVAFRKMCEFLGCLRLRTTAYHPATNGMVERFHRQLKAALKARDDRNDWVDNLAMTLLSIRATIKPDLRSSPAELVFGTTLRLPGEFFAADSPANEHAVSDFLTRIRRFARNLRPIAPRPPTQPSHLDPALEKCSHVFVRCDRVRQPLQPPYDGPFEVRKRTAKVFTVLMNGAEDTISVDRLKAAFVEETPVGANFTPVSSPSSDPVATTISDPTCKRNSDNPFSYRQPKDNPLVGLPTIPTRIPIPSKTRSGRRVHFPTHLTTYIC